MNDDVKNEDFEMKQTKGFITVAKGNEEYYQLAANLLRSYHLFCNNPLPFAILADQKNTYTDKFDDVIVFPDGASHSYLDKLSLGEYLPYDINIFIIKLYHSHIDVKYFKYININALKKGLSKINACILDC